MLVEDPLLPGGAVEVARREVLRSCKKEHVIEAFQSLVDDAVSVLRDNHVTVDQIVPLGEVVRLEELQLHLKKTITRFTRSKLLASPANTPQTVAVGAGRLLALVRAGVAAVDPAFVGAVFWPDAALAEANRKAWETVGTLKISHTRTNVAMGEEAMGEEARAALETEMRAFVERERAEEGYRVALKEQRGELMKDWERAQRNLAALREKAEEEKRKVEEEKKKEEEEKSEKKEEEKKEEEKKEEEKEDNKQNADEAMKEVQTTLDSVAAELDTVLALINNDAFLREATENKTTIEQRIEACQQQLLTLSPRFPSVTLEQTVVTPGRLRPVIIK